MNKNYPSRRIFLYCPIFIILYNFIGNLSNDLYLPTLPALTHELGTNSVLGQMTITLWFIGVALPQIYFGVIADRVGYRPLMLWGGLLFLVATFVCGIAPNIYILLIGRFFQGVAVSSLNIATFATVRSRFYDNTGSVKFISWVNMTGSLAPLLGPVMGSFIFQIFGWRSTFFCIIFLGLISIVGLYYFMFEGSEFHNKEIKFNIISSLAFYKSLINKKLIIPIITYTAFLGALIAYLSTAPFVVYELFNVPIKYFGLTQIAPFSCFIIGGLLVNKYVNRFKLSTIITFALYLAGISCLLFLGLILFPRFVSLYGFIGIVSLFLLSFALCGSPLVSLALGSSNQKGGIAALLGLSMASMASLASFLTALFYDGHLYTVCFIMTFFMFIGIFNYLLFHKATQ